MIIDFHTHTFPDDLADRAVGSLALRAGIHNYLDGRVSSLRNSMKEANIDYSVLLPVVTKPKQCSTVNDIANLINETSNETGLVSFGGIHPDNDNYRDILRNLANKGFKGIKLHPVSQNTNIDDIRYLRLINCAYENNLSVLIHAGLDISFPGCDEAGVDRIITMIHEVPPQKLILAHMGGWGMWKDMTPILGMKNVWLDTAFCLKKTADSQFLSNEYFVKMVRAHGADRILFGTDSPWSSQKETLELIKSTGLNESELNMILGNNASKLIFTMEENTNVLQQQSMDSHS